MCLKYRAITLLIASLGMRYEMYRKYNFTFLEAVMMMLDFNDKNRPCFDWNEI